jgi:radical SAM superfamily enzyme YgiQ (UPF0313 family)
MKKFRFLLIMPRFVDAVGGSYHFQFGIAYISSVMKQAGFNVFTLNLNHIDGDIESIIYNSITENEIDIVMVGGMSAQFLAIKRVIDSVRECSKTIQIVIGGGIISADPHVAMVALDYANIGVIGEGEETVVELCNKLQSSESSLSEIAGIIYSENGSWIQTKTRDEIADLDSLPFPDYEGFELNRYLELPGIVTSGLKGTRAFFLSCGRSCPYQCTFCFHTTGRKYRQRSMDNVAKEIKLLVEDYDVKHFMVLDELFARNKERVQQMISITKKYGVTWNAQFRVDDVDEGLVEILKGENCTNMRFGLESADNRILKSMRKQITIEQIEYALKLTYDAGLQINGDLIFGDIEETFETANNTLDWWEKNRDYGINCAFIITYPGTHLYRYAIQNSIIKDPVKFLEDGCPLVNVSKLNDNEFSLIAKRIMKISAEGSSSLAGIKNIHVNKVGKISFDGECLKCGTEQRFCDVSTFYSHNWCFCTKCGQKNDVQLPLELAKPLIERLKGYLVGSKMIAMWEIIPSSFILFESSDVFADERIIFIDNSPIKQKICIRGKTVHSPDRLLENDIDTAIYFHSYSYATVAESVKQRYKNIRNFINICDLLQ